jgi:Ca2+-binding RTX toxin-like protein
VLAGGAGITDVSRGGRGNDQYIFRIGDVNDTTLANADVIRDESGTTVQKVVEQRAGTLTAAQIAAALNGALFKSGVGLNNWKGGGVQLQSDGLQAGGEDVLVLGPGITIADIRLVTAANNKDLIVEIWKNGVFAGDRVLLQDWFNPFNQIETIRFADGNELRIADFDTFINGTDSADTIIGTSGNDFVYAGGGDDLVYLLAGNDFGNGAEGNDTVSGDSGNDIVVGANGDDVVLGGRGDDKASGGLGNDRVNGGDGQDIVSGGKGDDLVIGGGGNDIFKFARGDGKDIFIDSYSNEWEIVWASGSGLNLVAGYSWGGADGRSILFGGSVLFDGRNWSMPIEYDVESGILKRHKPANANAIVANGGTDSIEFGIGIDINDLQFQASGDGKDLIIGVEPSGAEVTSFSRLSDQITLKERGPLGNTGAKNSIENFTFFNTGNINITTTDLKGGTDGADTLTGVAGKENWITSGAGDDNITGQGSNDILSGNSGADTLTGGAGSDVLLGGQGNDILIGGTGGTRDGAAAGDILVGGEGFDTASYRGTVAVNASLRDTSTNTGDAVGDKYIDIEALEGSDAGDQLEGDAGQNELIGGKGADILKGGLGNDFYTIGRGDGADIIDDQFGTEEVVVVDAAGKLQPPFVERLDQINKVGGVFKYVHTIENSETGDIIYKNPFDSATNTPTAPALVASGWVKDGATAIYTISGSKVSILGSAGNAGADVLYLEDYTGKADYTGIQSIGLSDLKFRFDTVSPNDLLVEIIGQADVIRLKNFRSGAAAAINTAIETLQLSDGEFAALSALKFDASGNLLLNSTDTSAAPVDDFIVDTSINGNSLSGGFGADVLSGLDGNDTLMGGDGDDLLSGGMGADVINGGAGVDTATYFGGDAGVTVNLTTLTASGGEAAGDTFTSIENLIGTDYADTLTGDAGANVLKGNRDNDILAGNAGQDVLIGDEGNDSLSGGFHEDNLDGGDGDDTLDGGGDRDLVAGGDGNDILRGDGVAGSDIGGNLITNNSFEDTGDLTNDVVITSGRTTPDLTGWTQTGGTLFEVMDSNARSVSSTQGRWIDLDTGANTTVTQTLTGLTEGETLSLQFAYANSGAATTGSFEVLWNDAVIATITDGALTMKDSATLSVIAIKGQNTLSFRATGTVDGIGASIDNVRLWRPAGAADQLSGGAGVDRLEGGNGNDVLVGGDGNDNSGTLVSGGTYGGLYGGAGNDTLDGGTGNDTLDGGLGNDAYVFAGSFGQDEVIAGGGYDDFIFSDLTPTQLWLSQSGNNLILTAIGTTNKVTIQGWYVADTNKARRIVAGNKLLARVDVAALMAAQTAASATLPAAWPANNTSLQDAVAALWQSADSYVDRPVITGTTGNDSLAPDPVLSGGYVFRGLEGVDSITGSDLADTIYGNGGDDTLKGGKGDDSFVYLNEAGFDAVDGGDGSDSLRAETDNAQINLRSLTNIERISGNGKVGVIVNIADNATINLSAVTIDSVSRIQSGNGAETITGTSGNDFIVGYAGDILGISPESGDGNDVLFGGDGNDVIYGGAGADQLYGGAGDDILRPDNGADFADGGDGIDTFDQSYMLLDLNIDLIEGRARASLAAVGSGEQLISIENIVGGVNNDEIFGNDGTNVLDGHTGNDRLDGRGGDDTLIGSAGSDVLIGGLGVDTASYRTMTTASGTTSVVDTLSINGVVANLKASNSTNGTLAPAATATQGDAAGDWFFGIENLQGS